MSQVFILDEVLFVLMRYDTYRIIACANIYIVKLIFFYICFNGIPNIETYILFELFINIVLKLKVVDKNAEKSELSWTKKERKKYGSVVTKYLV